MSNGEIVSRGVRGLKGHWLTALLMALTVNLPGMLVQVLGIADNMVFSERLNSLVLNFYQQMADVMSTRSGLPDPDALLSNAMALAEKNRMFLWWGLSAAAWVVSPFLVLGMYHWLEELFRGSDTGYLTVFSRIGRFFSAVLLRLMIALKVLLWTLPGVALCLVGYLPLLLGAKSFNLVSTMFSLCFTAGTAFSLVLGIRAALRYSLSEFVMADNDRGGVRASIARSRELTMGKLSRVLGVMILFILLSLVSGIVSDLASGILGNVFGTVAGMLVKLAMAVLEGAGMTVLYLDMKGETIPEPAAEEKNDMGY